MIALFNTLHNHTNIKKIKMILSIIIPIYNVEQYVEKCLLSCINQKGVYKNDYEIIVVNDGSKDNSMKIVHEIASSHSDNTQISIISQKNLGLSEARNTGLRHAKGDYVWFVDSDDWIDEDSVENIIRALRKSYIDILQMPYKLLYEGSQKEDIEHVKKINTPITGKECMKITRLPNLAQSRILKRSFLNENGLKFEPGILHEDAEFKPRAIWNAKSIMTLDKPFYNYLKREKDSITASFTIRNAEGRWIGVKSMHEFSKNLSLQEKRLFNADMNFNMYFVLNGLKMLNQKDRNTMINELSKSRNIFKRLVWTLSPKKFLIYVMLYTAPKFVLNLYTELKKLNV